MQTCVPSTAGVSEIAACPPSPIAGDPSALPSPTSSLSSSVTLLACSLDASPVYQLLDCTAVLFEVQYYKIKNILCVLVFRVLSA